VLDTTLCDEVSQWGAFLRVVQFPPPIKLARHDITEILLKVAINTIALTPYILTIPRKRIIKKKKNILQEYTRVIYINLRPMACNYRIIENVELPILSTTYNTGT
jgi:hypothetical protein